MTAKGTPTGISADVVRQLEMLAQALIGVAEEEVASASVARVGQVEPSVTGYPTQSRPRLELIGGGKYGATAH